MTAGLDVRNADFSSNRLMSTASQQLEAAPMGRDDKRRCSARGFVAHPVEAKSDDLWQLANIAFRVDNDADKAL